MGRLRTTITHMVMREMENKEEDARGSSDGKRRGGTATTPTTAWKMVNEEEDAHGGTGDGKQNGGLGAGRIAPT
jgi:hypothetical protein